MTHEQAIELLKIPIHCADKGDEKDMREALDMAIKALEQEPSQVKNELKDELNELEPCSDAVSRQAVLDCFCGMLKMDEDTIPHVKDYLQTVVDRIKALPPVEPKRQDAIPKSVIDDIREEIEDYVCNKEEDTAKAQGMLNALQIMDEHIKAVEE